MMTKSRQGCSESWYDLDAQEKEALVGLRDAGKKLQYATTSRRFCPEGGGHAGSTGKSIDELKKVTPCNRCGAIGLTGKKIVYRLRENRKKRSLFAKRRREQVVVSGEENLMEKDEEFQTIPLMEVYITMVRRLTRHIRKFLLGMRFSIVVLPRICVEQNRSAQMAQTCCTRKEASWR